MLYAHTMQSPVGALTIYVSSVGVRAVYWQLDGDPVPRLDDEIVWIPDPAGLLARTQQQLEEYFAGRRRTFELPLDPVGSPFQQQVWEVLRGIPYGETLTYGEQARRLGDPNKARAVGAANGRNPIPIIVPCHRVVGANGSLTGFAGGLHNKAWLLDHERFTPADDSVAAAVAAP